MMRGVAYLLWRYFLVAALAASVAVVAAADEGSSYNEYGFIREYELCVSETNIYTARVDLYSGELGSYVFEECGLNNLNPTIGMEIGQTYTFVQKHRTNYYHALGFAYSPYGDEVLKVEVEPGTYKGGTNEDCIHNLTCPAPMYFLNDDYLGIYSNIPDVKPITVNETNFGLDEYEPLFFRNIHEWTSFGTFNIKLRIDDETMNNNDLFYFCHIHEFMGGRIKLLQNGIPLNSLDSPSLGYEYDEITNEFDKQCGTFGLSNYKLPNNPYCPNKFVCTSDGQDQSMVDFSSCIDAMNCFMMSGMTTGIKAESEAALFIHQMIPHHQNAVNMAKALLKTQTLQCLDLENGDGHYDHNEPDCVLEGILYQIVNAQNLQVQAMYDYLDSKRLPNKDNCNVYLETISEYKYTERLEQGQDEQEGKKKRNKNKNGSSSSSSSSSAAGGSSNGFFFVGWMMILLGVVIVVVVSA